MTRIPALIGDNYLAGIVRFPAPAIIGASLYTSSAQPDTPREIGTEKSLPCADSGIAFLVHGL